MRNCFRFATIVFLCGPVLLFAFSVRASAQSTAVSLPLFASPQPATFSADGECWLLTRTMCDGLPSEGNQDSNESQQSAENGGTFHRAARRVWRDQEELWAGPFKKSSLKWDAMVLVSTGALIATDRQTVPDVSQHTIDV